MKLTERLLGYLNRVFDKDPKPFAAMRVEGDQDWSWSVVERVLTVKHAGGTLSYRLEDMALSELIQAWGAVPGFSVTVGDYDKVGLRASVLLDGGADVLGGSIAPIAGYSSLLWAFMDGWAAQLGVLQEQVAAAPGELNLVEGSGVWLDEIGSHYGVGRGLNEPDGVYGPRVVAEALRPRSNNVALEAAIKVYTGQDATVSDVESFGGTFPLHDGDIDHDGAHVHNAVAISLYGLFDVVYGFDLEQGSDITSFQGELRKLIGRLRAAGTHLRALALQSSALADSVSRATDTVLVDIKADLSDSVTQPADAMAVMVRADPMTDVVSAPAETSVLQIPVHLLRNGKARRTGLFIHTENAILTQNIEGTVSSITPT